MGIGGIISGAAEAAKRAAAEAARKAAEAAAEAARKAAEATQKGAETAQKVGGTVKAGVEDAGDSVSSVVKDRAKDAFEDARDVASGAAGAVHKAAGGVVHRAEDVASGAEDKVKGAAGSVKDAVYDIGDSAFDAVSDPGKTLDKATDIAAGGLDKAGEALQNAPTLDPVTKLTHQVAGGLLQTSADVVRDPVRTANAAKDALSINKQVDDLKPGEHVKVGLNGEGDAWGIGVKGKGELEVKRNKEADGGGYTVAANGEVGAGLVAKLGAKGAAEAGASAFVNAGAKVEFKFATAEEAKRATNIIGKSALAAGAHATNPLVGAAANEVLGDPMSDLAGLKDKVSAVEFKLGADASAIGELGAEGLQGAAGVGANASLNGKQENTARVEFENGHPSKLALKQSWEVSAQGGARADPTAPLQRGKQGTPSSSNSSETGAQQGSSVTLPGGAAINGKGALKAEFEQSFKLPKDFDPTSLARDPAGAVRQIKESALPTHEAKLTLTDARQGSAKALGFGAGGGQEVKVEVKGNVRDISRSGALGSVLQGDFGKALHQLDGKVNTKATVQDKKTEGNNLGVGFHGGVGGGEAGLTSERTHLGPEHELTPQQLVELYQQQRWGAAIAG